MVNCTSWRMKEKIATRLIIQALIQITSAISSYFLLRNLAVVTFGIQGSVLTAINLFSVIYFIGIDIVYLQYSSEPNFKNYFTDYFLIKSVLVLISFIPLIIYVIVMDFSYNGYFFVMIIATLFLRFGDLFCLNLRANLKVMKGEIVEFLSGFGLSIARLIIALQLDKISNPLMVLGLFTLFFYFLKFVTSIIISKNDFYFSKIDKSRIINLFKDTLPLTFSTMIIILTDNLGNFIIDLSYSYEDFAQYYAINSYIIVLMTSISMSIAGIYQVYYSKWIAEKKETEISNFTILIEKYTAILYLLIVIGCYIAGKIFMELLLPNYLPGLIYLYILCFLPLFSGVNRPYIKLLYAARKQKLMAKYYTISRLMYLLIAILLIPKSIGSLPLLGLGAVGMSFIQIGINICDYIFYRYYCKVHLNIKYNKNFLLILGMALTCIFLFQIILKNVIFFESYAFIDIGIKLLIISILFFGALIFSKQITIKDYKIFRELLTIKNYKASINEEFKKPDLPE